MLQIVDQQNVGAAQLLFEREGLLVAQGGKKSPHEIFRAQEQGTRAMAFADFHRDRIQQMRLAVAEPAMNEQESKIAFTVLGDPLCRLVGELVRWTDHQAREAL